MINDHDNHEQAGNAKREPSVGYGKDEELARQETVTLIFLIKQIQIQIKLLIQIQIRQARGGGSPGGSNNFSHNFHCHQIQNYANKCLLSRAIFIATIITIRWLKGGQCALYPILIIMFLIMFICLS